MNILTKTSLTALAFVGGTLGIFATLSSCAGDDELQSHMPPGTGGYDPGDGGLMSSSSSSGSTGAGGQGGVLPPQCDDSLKRCDHLFTYPAGAEATVEVRGDFAPGAWNTGVPMTKQGAEWTATVEIPYNKEVLYKFFIDGATWTHDPNNPNQISDGFGGYNSILAAATCDPWKCGGGLIGDFDWRKAMLYFVFVDRFFDGDASNNASTPGVQPPADYRGGDWAGLLQKLQEGYFTDLGVNALWLSVPMDNTEQSGVGVGGDSHQYSAYHGYWPEALDQTEEHFGSMAQLQAVVAEAHGQGIKVILDYAMNHVHASSPVYQQHQNDGWFWPLTDGQVSNCVCGEGCSWDGPQGKRCWFTSYLPDFNFTNAAARDFSVSDAMWWIQETGIDGFRLDAVKHIEDQWLLDLRARVTAEVESQTQQHFYMVGETFTGDVSLINYYVDPITKLDGQFDFPLRMKLARSVLMRMAPMSDLEGFMNFNDNAYGAGIMSTFIGNHDIPRAIHLAQDQPLWTDEWAGGKELAWNGQPGLPSGMSAFERLGNAFTILFTTKGVPLIYYGDEIGMPGAGDPDNRRMMQWSGYSAGQSFLLAHIRKLTQIRKDHEALSLGTRTTLSVTADTYAYRMASATDTVFVAVNRSDSQQQIGGLPSGQLTDLLNGGTVSGPTVTVPARSARILTQ
ncbi:MAG: hypothetical protein IT372_32890 [Polyangiaceae bacterium]|nr:hypothetical protein [Polyangiaceae bacterium]